MNKTNLLSQASCLFIGRAGITTLAFISMGAISLATQAAEYNGPRITFDQVYAQPDNQELNLNYARQQAADGDYIAAAGTLERLLFAQPDWDSARLYYALVLHKLDDVQGAEQQLKLLDDRPLTAPQREQVALYRGELGKTRTANNSGEGNFSGRIVVGARWDDNAGNALVDSTLAVTNQGDIAGFLQGTFKFSAPMGANGLKFRAGVNGQTLRHDTFSNADFDTVGGNVGIGGNANNLSWSLDAQALKVFISGSDYLTQIGPKLSVSTNLSADTKVTLSGAYYDQDYKDLPFTFAETTRSGDKYTILASIKRKLSGQTTVGASIGYDNKKAANPLFAYDGIRFGANFRSKFDSGVYVKGRAQYRMLSYDTIAPAVQRDDDHISGKISVGAALSDLGINVDNMAVEGGVNYINRGSNIAGLDYENFGAEFKFIFDF